MKSLADLIPAMYLEADADGSLSAFIAAFDQVHDNLVAATENLAGANQPRRAPLGFINHLADHYGSPFPFMTAERWQEGSKLENLVYLYTLRGTSQGIQTAIRYLTGINATVLQDFEYCWKLGVSRLGGPLSTGSTLTGFGTSFGTAFGS